MRYGGLGLSPLSPYKGENAHGTYLKLIRKAQLHCLKTAMLMTGRLCRSVSCMVRVLLHMLERPVSGCRPSLLEVTILR